MAAINGTFSLMKLKFKFTRVVCIACVVVAILLFANYPLSSLSLSPNPLDLVFKHKPNVKEIGYKTDARIEQVFTNTPQSMTFTKEYLESFLDLPRETIDNLKDAFAGFLHSLKAQKVESFGKLGTQSKGILTIGGGKFTWLALLGISQIRSTGCTLPIEIFIPHHEHYDAEFCKRAEETLNAKCIRGPSGLKLDSFQWKIIAIYYSSFENVLFLDSDNTVLKNPTPIFSLDKFINTGLVLWPDAWTRTTHPAFYDIINVKVNEVPNGKFHANKGAMPDPTNESGMILVNKRKHAETLFVALYFNIFGPKYYYPLITQGGAGEGDKDTFMAAVFAVDAPYYIVHNTLHFVGYFRSGNEGFHSNALAHCNPLAKEEKEAFQSQKVGGTCHDLMFIHLSFPKYYLETLGPNLKLNGKDLILYETLIPYIENDFELGFWENLAELICNDWMPLNEAKISPFKSLGNTLKYVQDSDSEEICHESILPHLNFLRKWFKKSVKDVSQFEQ